jgi:hypothetical protein
LVLSFLQAGHECFDGFLCTLEVDVFEDHFCF